MNKLTEIIEWCKQQIRNFKLERQAKYFYSNQTPEEIAETCGIQQASLRSFMREDEPVEYVDESAYKQYEKEQDHFVENVAGVSAIHEWSSWKFHNIPIIQPDEPRGSLAGGKTVKELLDSLSPEERKEFDDLMRYGGPHPISEMMPRVMRYFDSPTLIEDLSDINQEYVDFDELLKIINARSLINLYKTNKKETI